MLSATDIVSLVIAKPETGRCRRQLRRIRDHATTRRISPSGANLMLLLMSAQEEEWDDIDLAIRQFQGMTQAIKFSPKPVVIAPFGMTLGGGCEISLHAAARQPHAELYMGLVEVGVGLLPGGGGCKEMLLRAVDSATAMRPRRRGESVEMMEAMKKIFETIAIAKVSTSAHEARGLGFVSQFRPHHHEPRTRTGRCQGASARTGHAGYEPPAAANRHSRARRKYSGYLETGHPPDASGRITSATMS